MHVLQYIAVKAESPEEAIDMVRSSLEVIMGEDGSGATWYDWFVTGGGRWNAEQDSYTDGATNMIISAYNREEFEKTVSDCIERRIAEFNHYRKSWDEKGINLNATLDSYSGELQYSFDLYPLGKMIDMLQGKWDFNSQFFDIENWSTNSEHMTKDIVNDGGLWFLVPVDFHY